MTSIVQRAEWSLPHTRRTAGAAEALCYAAMLAAWADFPTLPLGLAFSSSSSQRVTKVYFCDDRYEFGPISYPGPFIPFANTHTPLVLL